MRCKIISGLTVFAVVLLLVNGYCFAKSGQKIAFFDLQKVIKTSKWGQEVQSKLKTEESKIKSKLKQKQEELRKLQQDFQKKQAMLGTEAKKKKIAELEKKRREGEKFIVESNRKMQNLSQELMKPLLEKIFEVVKEIAKKEKIDFVFEARRSGMVFADDKYDITDKIIKRLDKIHKK